MSAADVQRAVRAKVRLEVMCLPCYYGDHSLCRHHPNGRQFESGPRPEPCRCEEQDHTLGAGTCSAAVRGDGFWSYNDRCCRPAKAKVMDRAGFVSTQDVELERCGIHLAAMRKVQENDARRHAEYESRRAGEERDRETRKASAAWAARLRDEFGIDASAAGAARGLRVEVKPEALYGVLVEVVGLLRDAGIDDHPLQPRTEET